MSGFDIIYVAGVILLLELLFGRLIKLTHLWRQLLAAARDPLPPARQLEAATDIRSKNVSDLATHKTDE
jgi:hypothetical protein